MFEAFKTTRKEKILFLSSFAVKCFFIAATLFTVGYSQPFADIQSDAYLPLAENLYNEHAFTFSTTTPYVKEATHTPGYPLFLAIFAVPFTSVIPAYILQAILFSISVVLLYRLCAGFLSDRVRFWGALLYGVEPYSSFIATSALSEALFMFLFILALYVLRVAWERGSIAYFFAGGLLFGLSVLVRPIVLYLLPVLLICGIALCLYQRRKNLLKGITIAVLSALLCLGAWSARNHQAFGVWSISTKGPFTLYFYEVEQLLEYKNGWNATETADNLLAYAIADNPQVQSREDLRNPIYASYLSNKSLEIIKESPLLFIKIHVFSLATFFLSDGYRLLLQDMHVTDTPLPNITKSLATGEFATISGYFAANPLSAVVFFFGTLFWGLATMLAFLSIIFVCMKKTPLQTRLGIIFFLMLLAYFAAITGAESQARYRIVITPFLFMLASYSFFSFKELIGKRWRVRYSASLQEL